MLPRHNALVVYCGVLYALSAFSIDIMLPALSAITDSLNTKDTLTKMTVTVYLLAFGCGQMIFGPLSDRWGRRPALIAGLGIYLAGGLLSGVADSISVLLGGRFLQGLGGAVGHVIGRALLRDLYSGRTLARQMAMAMGVFAIGPLIAPLLGWALAAAVGWRAVFIGMSGFGGALLLIAVVALPETIKVRNPQACHWSHMLALTRRFWHCRQSRFFLLLGGWVSISMQFFLANSAQLYAVHFGVTGLLFALFFASQGIGIALGQTVNRILIGKIGIVNSARTAAAVFSAAVATVLLLAQMEALNAPLFAVLVFVFASGYLAVIANAAALAMDQHGDMAGFASSLIGFVAMSVGAIGASVLTAWYDSGMTAWSAYMLAVCASSLIALLAWREQTDSVKTPRS